MTQRKPNGTSAMARRSTPAPASPPVAVRPSWRKPAGMFMIMGLIVIWAFMIGSLSNLIANLPMWVQIPLYIVTGIIWIMPLKPLLRWMETGRWR